jgi:hypothetical protein
MEMGIMVRMAIFGGRVMIHKNNMAVGVIGATTKGRQGRGH